MYEVIFNQIVKDHEDESNPNYVCTTDLERALALASLLQKISTPEIFYENVIVQPLNFDGYEVKKNSSTVSEN